MTFSIAGRCARTGQVGCVVTTSAMAVGSRFAFAEAGVGATLTQNRTDPRLGPAMLAGLRRGEAPDAILQSLERDDPNLRWRQLAVIAADGRAAFCSARRSPRSPRAGSAATASVSVSATSCARPKWSTPWSRASRPAPPSR